MLSQKHGRNADENGENAKDNPPIPFSEAFAVPRGEKHGKGAYHMQRRTDVGIGIEIIKVKGDVDKEIVPSDFLRRLRTELLHIRENGINKTGDAVCNDDKPHIFFESRNLKKHGI